MSWDKRSPTRSAKKRCSRCGRISWVRPRQRHCKQMERNAFGKSGSYCWGELTKVGPSLLQAAILAARREAARAAAKSPIAQAQRELKKVKAALQRVEKAQKKLRGRRYRLEQKALRLEVRSQMTDEQVLAENATKAIQRAVAKVR